MYEIKILSTNEPEYCTFYNPVAITNEDTDENMFENALRAQTILSVTRYANEVIERMHKEIIGQFLIVYDIEKIMEEVALKRFNINIKTLGTHREK